MVLELASPRCSRARSNRSAETEGADNDDDLTVAEHPRPPACLRPVVVTREAVASLRLMIVIVVITSRAERRVGIVDELIRPSIVHAVKDVGVELVKP